MKRFWNWIDGMDLAAEKKYTLCRWILGIALALAGGALDLARAWMAKLGLDWLPVLAGWPVLLSWVGVFLYGCRHPFH